MKKLMKKALKFSIVTAVIGVIAGYFAASMMFDSYDVTTKKLILNQMSESQFYIIVALQTALLYGGVLSFIGYILSSKIGLLKDFTFKTKETFNTLIITTVCGFIFFADYFTFGKWIPQIGTSYVKEIVKVNTIIGQVLYGGIIEEILCRLFLMSLISFILWKLFSKKSTKENIPTWIFITANIVTAFVFALGHLPATITLFGGTLPPLALIRCFILNGAFGIVFGYLYRKKGIQYAMVGHATTHLVRDILLLLVL